MLHSKRFKSGEEGDEYSCFIKSGQLAWSHACVILNWYDGAESC